MNETDWLIIKIWRWFQWRNVWCNCDILNFKCSHKIEILVRFISLKFSCDSCGFICCQHSCVVSQPNIRVHEHLWMARTRGYIFNINKKYIYFMRGSGLLYNKITSSWKRSIIQRHYQFNNVNININKKKYSVHGSGLLYNNITSSPTWT